MNLKTIISMSYSNGISSSENNLFSKLTSVYNHISEFTTISNPQIIFDYVINNKRLFEIRSAYIEGQENLSSIKKLNDLLQLELASTKRNTDIINSLIGSIHTCEIRHKKFIESKDISDIIIITKDQLIELFDVEKMRNISLDKLIS
jgi:hypothetical protein